ncbi:hypothetical protein VTK73DRAFT_10276 [Phialemonium thermophilum]|uniref:Uncharacterized protein n=1 Tax=Phialemonium thermophilum TaxID=223376 RepID=A0ABR3XGQ6_9PEZI
MLPQSLASCTGALALSIFATRNRSVNMNEVHLDCSLQGQRRGTISLHVQNSSAGTEKTCDPRWRFKQQTQFHRYAEGENMGFSHFSNGWRLFPKGVIAHYLMACNHKCNLVVLGTELHLAHMQTLVGPIAPELIHLSSNPLSSKGLGIKSILFQKYPFP